MSDKLAKYEETTAIAVEGSNPYAPGDFSGAWRLAKVIVTSRLAPGIETPEQAFVVLATGHELGLSPMQSIRGIYNIKGRPCPSADTLVAVCLASGKAEYFREVSNDGASATWETKRVGGRPQQYTFTMAEAKAAGIAGGMYQKFPKRMLAARAKAFLARDVYPDLLLGLYTPEEVTGGMVAPEIEVVEPEPEPEPDYPEPDDEPADTVSVVDSFADLINACRTEEHLAAVAADIKRAVKSEQDKAALVTVWKARREAIRSEAA